MVLLFFTFSIYSSFSSYFRASTDNLEEEDEDEDESSMRELPIFTFSSF